LELDLKNGGMLWRETEKRGGKEDGEIGAVFVLDLAAGVCFVSWSGVDCCLGIWGWARLRAATVDLGLFDRPSRI
jgi:hypothetical protein